jgi:hypothetical protein
MYYVDLPELPSELIYSIKIQANVMALDENCNSGKEYNTNKNFAYTEIEEFLYSKLVSDLLLPKLKKPTTSYIFVLRNKQNIPADFPPHLDEYRKLSLNYIVETGGNNVQTSFYDLERPKDDNEFKSKNIPYEDLNKTQKYVLPKNKWNLSNTQVCHSVENLDDLRIILFVVFDDNTDYETFTKDYTELLTEVPNLLTVFNSNKFI